MTGPLRHLVVGPGRHGVTRYAELLLSAGDVPTERVVRVPHRVGAADLPDLLTRLPAGVPVHTHVTDHLFGSSPEEALDVLRALAAGRSLSVTLHDLPQPSDGAPWARRRACYAGVARVADRVVVSSEHEHRLLSDVLGQVPDPTAVGGSVEDLLVQVVPLAASGVRGAGPSPLAAADREVAVLGFVYPGKGHAEVLDALAGLTDDVVLRVLGGPSPGHEDLVRGLVERGAATGRRVLVDGWVDDAHLPALLRQVAVPVFAPRHVSASGSLAEWTAAGRRPVATRSRYTAEVERRSPGTLLLVDDTRESLAEGVSAALLDPASTWTDVDAVAPDPALAAAATFGELVA